MLELMKVEEASALKHLIPPISYPSTHPDYHHIVQLHLHLSNQPQSPKMVTALPIATIIVFAILATPITYCCFKHGRGGLLGWGIIQSFCLIRIIGGILEIRTETTGQDATAALIVTSIGLSPMILGTLGVLHEA